MNLHCKVCDRSIIENEFEYKDYIAALRKKIDKSLYIIKLTIMLTWMNSIKY